MVSDLHKKRLLILFAFVVCVSILAPLVFGDARVVEGEAGGDSWRNFIYDFQTLLTGVLAIAAAWWNVTAMKASDSKNDRRHKEVLERSRGEQARIVERAVNPQAAQLRGCLDFFKRQKSDILQINTFAGQIDRLDIMVPVMEYCIGRLDDALARRQFEEGMRLFDGELTYQIDLLRKNVAGATQAAKIAMQDRYKRAASPTSQAYFAKSDLYRFMVRAEGDIASVLDGLKKIAAKYEVDVLGLDHE